MSDTRGQKVEDKIELILMQTGEMLSVWDYPKVTLSLHGFTRDLKTKLNISLV